MMAIQMILSGYRKKTFKHSFLFIRIYVSNDPSMEKDWEIVLEGSFEEDGNDVFTDIKVFPLDTEVNEKRYIKFEIISFGEKRGCIQYFDVDRKPKLERSGDILLLIMS